MKKRVAKGGVEPPIARSELAVLPLHYMASLENCLSSQTGREINNIYIFKIWKVFYSEKMLYNKKYVKRMWTGQDLNLQIRACHGVLSIKLLALKNTSILTNRCSALYKIFILKYSLTYYLI